MRHALVALAVAVPAAPTGAAQPSPASGEAVQATPPVAEATAETVETYGPRKPDDTLWSIAKSLKPRRPGATAAQIAWAIYLANPAQFRGDPDRLRPDAVLKIPDLATITAVDAKLALAYISGEKPLPDAAPTFAQPQLPSTTGDSRPPPLAPPAVPVPAPIVRPPSEPPAAAGGLEVTVERFKFDGNSAYADEVLAPLVESYLNRKIPLVEIYDAADAVTDFYVRNGYTLASVVVPAQRISGGVVKLQVIEGRIGQIIGEGLRNYPLATVKQELGDLPEGKLYRGEELESGLRRVNRLPGLSAKAVLQPGAKFGATDILIQAREQAWSVATSVDNHGRESLGEIRASLSGTLNSYMLPADRLQLLYLHSQSGLLHYGSIGYSAALPADLRLKLNYGEANFEVAGFPVEGRNRTGRVTVERWLLDKPGDALQIEPGVVYTQANTDLVGVPISERQLTLAELGVRYTHNYSNFAASQAALTLQSNFASNSEADCTPSSGNPACENVLLRWDLDFQHIQPIVGRLDSYVHVNYAGSMDPLPDVSQVSVGGPNSVRAYPAAEIRGDRGLLGSVGLRQGFRIGRALLHARAFADGGIVECEIACGNDDDDDNLSSAGAGFDLFTGVGDLSFTGKVEWSVALDNHADSINASSDDKQRVFAVVAMSY